MALEAAKSAGGAVKTILENSGGIGYKHATNHHSKNTDTTSTVQFDVKGWELVLLLLGIAGIEWLYSSQWATSSELGGFLKVLGTFAGAIPIAVAEMGLVSAAGGDISQQIHNGSVQPIPGSVLGPIIQAVQKQNGGG